MSILAAVHLAPAVGVPLAVAALAALVLFFGRLSQPDVPLARRRVRRAATMVMAAGVPALLIAVSFADPSRHPTMYVGSWSLVVVLLIVVVGLAFIDMAVSSWLIGLEHDGEAMRRGAAVLAALEAEAERRAADPEGDDAPADGDGDGDWVGRGDEDEDEDGDDARDRDGSRATREPRPPHDGTAHSADGPFPDDRP